MIASVDRGAHTAEMRRRSSRIAASGVVSLTYRIPKWQRDTRSPVVVGDRTAGRTRPWCNGI